jgi:hypothetical protein
MGDGTTITLYEDGSFLGFHSLARALEPKPARVLTQAQAKAAIARAKAKVAPGSTSGLMPARSLTAGATFGSLVAADWVHALTVGRPVPDGRGRP